MNFKKKYFESKNKIFPRDEFSIIFFFHRSKSSLDLDYPSPLNHIKPHDLCLIADFGKERPRRSKWIHFFFFKTIHTAISSSFPQKYLIFLKAGPEWFWKARPFFFFFSKWSFFQTRCVRSRRDIPCIQKSGSFSAVFLKTIFRIIFFDGFMTHQSN